MLMAPVAPSCRSTVQFCPPTCTPGAPIGADAAPHKTAPQLSNRSVEFRRQPVLHAMVRSASLA